MDEFSENPKQESKQDQDDSSLDSLEGTSTVVETPAGQSADAGTPAPDGTGNTGNMGTSPQKPTDPHRGFLKRLFGRANIYLLLFVLILVVAGAVVVVAYLHSRSAQNNTNIASQTLSQSALKQLANSDVTVGGAQQTLNVQSNAVFAGQVLIRSNLAVAGKLQIGSSLSLAGIQVSGTSQFDQVQISKNLSVAGDAAIQGQLTVQKSLNVNGGGTFNGAVSATALTADSLQLNGDLILTHHISAGGVTPGRSNGGALGSGGTASVSGSDTSGSIAINTGSGAYAGCLVSLTFATPFHTTPHVIVTPVGSAAGNLGYYVNRSSTSFSVCTDNKPPDSATFGFDYMVLD
ncbi:MAG TPA: hypothetical protein VF261_02180 [Candidatus Saccharimonadales bacterium]